MFTPDNLFISSQTTHSTQFLKGLLLMSEGNSEICTNALFNSAITSQTIWKNSSTIYFLMKTVVYVSLSALNMYPSLVVSLDTKTPTCT